jgi:hypothetical protein
LSRSDVEKRRAEARRLHEKQRGLCWVCGLPMRLRQRGDERTPFDATIDHIVQRGMTDGQKRPTKAAHAICNHARNHKTLAHEKMREHVRMMWLRDLARRRLGRTFLGR